MPESRLLPAAQRTALPTAPTTSRWWRTHVLVRSWLNRHRHRWLAPLLVCAPPVGVAMVWAGATRPGHGRRWLTAAAVVWSLVVLLTVSLVALPGGSPADAGGAPPPVAGGPALSAGPPSSSPTHDDAAAVAAVRGTPVGGAGLGAAAVETPAPDREPGTTTAPAAGSARSASSAAPVAPVVPAAPVAPVAPVAAPPATTKPAVPSVTPTPTPAPHQTPPAPRPPSLPTVQPFAACSAEGAHAVSPNGFPLRCLRTPIGLYWLWGR